jgi:hypothetical protein
MISTKNIFLKNDFPENILQWKSFYTETNGTLNNSSKEKLLPEHLITIKFHYRSSMIRSSVAHINIVYQLIILFSREKKIKELANIDKTTTIVNQGN